MPTDYCSYRKTFLFCFFCFLSFFLYEFITTRLRLTDWALASFSESFSLKYRKALYEQFLSVNARIINYSYSVWYGETEFVLLNVSTINIITGKKSRAGGETATISLPCTSCFLFSSLIMECVCNYHSCELERKKKRRKSVNEDKQVL